MSEKKDKKMKKGDKFKSKTKDVTLVFEKYDKHGDALFTSPDIKFEKMPGIEEGYMCLPVHAINAFLKKIED